MSNASPKYSMAVNPVYQVDWSAAASGKTVAQTKRRVRFRFGFSNAEALAAGETGTACRGEEHEVTLVWSLTSGKRLVLADGQEVHVSRGGRAETKFETSWTMPGGHTLKIIAHAAPPLRYTPGFRQFDLHLDGCSYFEMPKIYELGVKNPMGRQLVRASNPRSFAEPPAYNNYSLPEYERQEYADYGARTGEYDYAKPRHYDYEREEYTQDRRIDDSAPSKDPSSVHSPKSVMDAPPPQQDLVSDPTPVQDVQDLIDSPVALLEATAPAVQQDEFTPVEPVEQPRDTAVVHNEILSAYGPPPANPGMLALTNGETVPPPAAVPVATPPNYQYASPPPPQQYNAVPPQPVPQQYANAPPPQYPETPQYAPAPQQYAPAPPQYAAPAPQQYAPAPPQYTEAPPQNAPVETAVVTPDAPPAPQQQQLTMNQLMDAPLEEEPVDEMSRALKNLVNIDDITTETTAPEQKKIEEKRQEMSTRNKSKPLPPTAPSWHLGTKPALSDIKANAPEKAAPTKEIMKTHAFDPRAAQAGMMVIYGAPELAAPGFGVPAAMQQQRMMYAQQQQMYMRQQQQQQQQMYAGY